MILPSRFARRWLVISLGLVIAAILAYGVEVQGGWVRHGGSAFGLAYGVIAALLVFVLLAFGVRKRWYRSTLGTLDGWLQSHIGLGLVVVVVVLLHSGWRFHDALATTTLWVLMVVVASGLFGARAYASVPRRLSAVESNLTPREISDELNRLARVMARLASSGSPALVRIFQRLMAGATPGRFAGWRLLFAAGGAQGPGEDSRAHAQLLASVSEVERPVLRQLLVLWRQHREMYLRLRAQERYRKLLQAWLFLHLPLSILLLVLLILHIIFALYYGAGDVLGAESLRGVGSHNGAA